MIKKIVRYTCDKCGRKREVSLQDYYELENNTGYRNIKFGGKYLTVCPECNKKLNDLINEGYKEEEVEKIISTLYVVGKYTKRGQAKYICPFSISDDFDFAKECADKRHLDIFREDTIEGSGVRYFIFDYKQNKFVEVRLG